MPQKRKAQNRAAQRAFRERKAARVNDLETKLQELQADRATQNQDYRDQLQQLTEDNLRLTQDLTDHKAKIESLQKELDLIRQLKDGDREVPVTNFVTQVASPAPSSGHETPPGQSCTCTDELHQALCSKKPVEPLSATSVPLRRRSTRNKPQITPESTQSPDLFGCGQCTAGGSCACLDKFLGTTAVAPHLMKRPTSPTENAPKRTRTCDYAEVIHEDLEIDFTSAYITKPASTSSIAQISDPCGFCSDGTPCVCAEVANSLIASEDSEERHGARLAPLRDNHTSNPTARTQQGLERPVALHPPMNTSAVKPSGGCQPGGCAQCLDDPMSTLFCQSVATKICDSQKSGCCGGGRCGDIEGSRRVNGESKVDGGLGGEKRVFIPCSAAYQTLSRHRAFEEATTDLGSLVRPLLVRSLDGNCPQIEVSSIREVLRRLDRGFGSDARK